MPTRAAITAIAARCWGPFWARRWASRRSPSAGFTDCKPVPGWRRKSRRSSPGSLARPAPRRLSLRPRGFGRQPCPPLFEFGQIKGRFRFVPLIDTDLSGLVADPHRAGREWFEVHHLRRPTGIVGDEIQGDEPVDRFDVLEDEESALAAISRGPSRVTERLLRGQCGKTGIDQTSSIKNTSLTRLKFLSFSFLKDAAPRR